ncbi:MAG: TrkA C-terminal domain-containing protein [Desulfurococcaceae archaeon]
MNILIVGETDLVNYILSSMDVRAHSIKVITCSKERASELLKFDVDLLDVDPRDPRTYINLVSMEDMDIVIAACRDDLLNYFVLTTALSRGVPVRIGLIHEGSLEHVYLEKNIGFPVNASKIVTSTILHIITSINYPFELLGSIEDQYAFLVTLVEADPCIGRRLKDVEAEAINHGIKIIGLLKNGELIPKEPNLELSPGLQLLVVTKSVDSLRVLKG